MKKIGGPNMCFHVSVSSKLPPIIYSQSVVTKACLENGK